MGSGNNNRKDNDAPIIRRPKIVFSSGIGVPDVGEKAAEVCVASFDQIVEKTMLTKPGVRVHLQVKGELYSILIGENVIGKLSQKYSKMIKTCIDMGVRYSGEIIEKNNRPYARFNRISK